MEGGRKERKREKGREEERTMKSKRVKGEGVRY